MGDQEPLADQPTDVGPRVTPSQVQPTVAALAPAEEVTGSAPHIRPIDADAEMVAVADPHQPGRSGRRVATLVAAGLALVLVVGLGAYVAYRTFFADGRRPEHFTPASVAALVSVDLDASLGQQVKLLKLAAKVSNQGGAAASIDTESGNILADLLDRLKLTGVDVKRDLTSWLGLRAALGLWVDGQSRPYALVTATTTDDAKATAGLDRIRKTLRDAELGFVVRDGTALIAIGERDAQRAADAAAAEAAKTPLDALASYRNARKWLGDGQLVVAWLDLDRYSGALADTLGGLGGMSGLAGTGDERGPIASTPATAVQGTSIAGVSVTDDGLEARYRAFNGQTKAGGMRDALARLSDLPANTQVGAVLAVPEYASAPGAAASPYGLLIGLLGGSMLSTSKLSIVEGPLAGPTPKVPSEAELSEMEALLTKDPADLTEAEAKRLRDLIGFDPSDLADPNLTPDEVADPFADLSGAVLSLTIGRVAGEPSGRLVAEVTSSDAAASLSELARTSGDRYTVTAHDKTVTVVSKDYVPGGGKLSDQAAFQKAMADAPAETDLALYADLGSALAPAQRQGFPIRTVGVVQGREGSDVVGFLRVVIG